jgi:splicing factor 3A subunit 2
METIDLTKDPYFMKNHLGTFECRLCLTLHSNEGSYLGKINNYHIIIKLIKRQLKNILNSKN